jgi:hypothetical protein
MVAGSVFTVVLGTVAMVAGGFHAYNVMQGTTEEQPPNATLQKIGIDVSNSYLLSYALIGGGIYLGMPWWWQEILRWG